MIVGPSFFEASTMIPNTKLAPLLALPLADRLELVEALWDSIADDSEPTALSASQQAELEARLARHDAGTEASHSWDDVVAAARAACEK